MGNNVGGIYLYVDDHIPEWPFISRCIVAFNEGYGVDVSTDNWFSGGYFFSWGPPLSASNVFGNQQGDYPPDSEVLTKHFGILSSDPRFVDWESGNFELMPNSPCLPEGNYCRTLMGALGMTDPTAVDDELALASNLRLLQNFPNPFNPCTRIDFYLGVGQIVTVSIYDASGRRVSELLCNHPLEAGHHSIAWHGDSDSGESVASGVYFIQIKTPLDSQRRKMLLLK